MKQSLFIDKELNINLNKHVSNQNLAMKNINNMKDEMEILYGRNTGENYDVNKTNFDNESGFENPFKIVDITEEYENICHNFDFKIKENNQIEDEFILEGKQNLFHLKIIKFYFMDLSGILDIITFLKK